jgi:hypothetical protein
MVSGQLHASASLLLENIFVCPTSKRLGGPQSQYGPYGQDNYLLFLSGINLQLLRCPAPSLVAIPTELLRLASCYSPEENERNEIAKSHKTE